MLQRMELSVSGMTDVISYRKHKAGYRIYSTPVRKIFHVQKNYHEIGVKHIDRYLKGTKTKGLVMKPDLKNLRLYLFADGDFVCLYSTKDKQYPISVKSRTGLLLNFGGVPILWSSKLQSEIALSTMEVENIALSQGIKELVAGKSFLAKLGA